MASVGCFGLCCFKCLKQIGDCWIFSRDALVLFQLWQQKDTAILNLFGKHILYVSIIFLLIVSNENVSLLFDIYKKI